MKKLRVLFVITYILLICVGFLRTGIYSSIPVVSLTQLKIADVDEIVTCTGSIVAKSYGVFSQNAARVAGVYVNLGDRVSSGERLARVDGSDYSVDVFSAQVYPQINSITEELEDYVEILGQLGLYDFEELLPDISFREFASVTTSDETIIAPSDGVITSVSAVSGRYASLVSPLFVITDTSDMTLVAKINEDKIQNIELGQHVVITGTGFPGRSYEGYVSQIAPTASPALLSSEKSTVEVEIKVENPDNSIMDGFTATGKIFTSKSENVKQLALECILQDDDGKEYVFLYEDGYIKRFDISCEYSSTDYAQVYGLEEGCLIVYAPDSGLKDGQRVLLDKEWLV